MPAAISRSACATPESLTLVQWTSPLGPLWLALSPVGVVRLSFMQPPADLPPTAGEAHKFNPPWLAHLKQELQAYFAGFPVTFAAVPVALVGTPFQMQVWQILRQLPFAATCSYGELARRLGQPRAARAVGQACGANPVPLIIPCHRVIAADGSLGGYRGPLAIKHWLLAHEAKWGNR